MIIAALVSAIALQLIPSISPQAWKAQDSVSAVDGQRTYTARIQSAELVYGSVLSHQATLWVGCINGDRVVSLAWPGHLQRDTNVTWRVEGGEPRKSIFRLPIRSSSRLISLYGVEADRMLTAIEGADRLYVRVEAYDLTQEASYSIAGAESYVATVREACR